MRIFLLGLMGCGKTTVGKKLAKKLGYVLVDLDELIEQKSGISISGYFEKYGEDKFRLFEQQILRETFKLENSVISTGGGTPCFFNNIFEIQENGLSFYLKGNANLLFSRLKTGREQRPLIKNLTDSQLIEYLDALIAKREKFYNKATYTVNAIDPLDEILQILDEHS